VDGQFRQRCGPAVNAGQPPESQGLRAQQCRGDQALAIRRVGWPPAVVAGELELDGIEAGLAGGIDERLGDVGERVVAGHAVDRPVRREPLAPLGDLLHGEPGVGSQLAQPGQVALRVTQSVRVVDAQPVDPQFRHPAADFDVGGVEDRAVLDAEASELGDGEESAVVLAHVGGRVRRQLVVLRCTDLGNRTRRRVRRQRERPVVVAQDLVRDADLRLGLQAEHRQQEAALVPVDVEPRRVLRLPPEPQHVPPRRILGGVGHAHVVGDDVHDHAQASFVGLFDQLGQCLRTAALGVDPAVVDDVIAVIGAAHRLE
jgi:hypothetical protein